MENASESDLMENAHRVHREARRYLDPEVAAILHQARRARGWSYRVAGKRTGLAFGYLAELEAGRRVPSIAAARVLIDAYELTGASAEAVLSVALVGVGRDWRSGPPRQTEGRTPS
jgi:ribosome-binding protein aMBF1 (putative translation factor)